MSVKSIVIAVLVILIVAFSFDAVFIINEKERALLLRFGAVQTANLEPGLHFKIPIADVVKRFDGRILTVDTSPDRFFTIEKKPLNVDAFVKWRILDVPQYYTATSGEEVNAARVIEDRLNEGLRNQIGRRDMHEVVSGARDKLMQELTAYMNEAMSNELGIEIIDVRVKKIDLPTEVSEEVFLRMNSERAIEAKQYRANGQEIAIGTRADAEREALVLEAEAYKQAQQIRGEGDAESARIFADAFSQNREFFEFYLLTNSYKSTLADPSTLLVLDPTAEYFKYLKNQ